MGDLTWELTSNVDELSALDDYLTLHRVTNVEALPKIPIEATDSQKGAKQCKHRTQQQTRNTADKGSNTTLISHIGICHD